MASKLEALTPLFVLVLVVAILGMGARVIDLLSDVLWWVARRRHRTGVQHRLASTIAEYRGRNPNALVTLVGHSLGSVVVAETLQSIEVGEPVPDYIVTMGSPLAYLFRIFPRAVGSPEMIYEGLRAHGVKLWVNLWRPWDLVGRSIPLRRVGFAQASVGSRGHSDYWSDEHVRTPIAALILDGTLPKNRPETLVARSLTRIWTAERWPHVLMAMAIAISGLIAWLTMSL